MAPKKRAACTDDNDIVQQALERATVRAKRIAELDAAREPQLPEDRAEEPENPLDQRKRRRGGGAFRMP